MKKQLIVMCCIIVQLLYGFSGSVRAQGVGVPYFENYLPSSYEAHARNFDVVCDTLGRVIVANFEGIVVTDKAKASIIHTPGISRITKLYKDKQERIWFGGYQVFGYLDDLTPYYIISDSLHDSDLGEVDMITELNGRIVVHTSADDSYYLADNDSLILDDSLELDTPDYGEWDGHRIVCEISPSPLFSMKSIEGIGLVTFGQDGSFWSVLSTDEGICSNTINALACDEGGSVWAATDNGVFRIAYANPFSRFRDWEGLKGEIRTILTTDGEVYAGTMSGIFLQHGSEFKQMFSLEHACWQLVEIGEGNYVAATSIGLFLYNKKTGYHRISDENTLSVLPLSDDSFFIGQLDGIHYIKSNGENRLISSIPRVTSMSKGADGSIIAKNLFGQEYKFDVRASDFIKLPIPENSYLINVQDPEGLYWRTMESGLGIHVVDADGNEVEQFNQWLTTFKNTNINAIAFDDDVIWLGTADALIRVGRSYMRNNSPIPFKVHIRSFEQKGRDVSIVYSVDRLGTTDKVDYSYRLGKDQKWSAWDDDNDATFFNLTYGDYELTVRAMDEYGQVYESAPYPFTIPYPFYLRWYSVLFYNLLIVFLVAKVFSWRQRRLVKEQMRLEQIVRERTQEVIDQKNEIEAQKNEIEEKTLRLEDTLTELKETQNQLLRQEREATVGKLTTGLIDRILNPLNYINNFSHLSIGLAKDLKADIDDEQENMTEDNFEDAQDVLDMLGTNLAKIEQHGLSTTRILKAMEELLKDRSSQLSEVDIVQSCDQAIEMFSNYKKDDLARIQATLDWQKPADPVMVNAMSAQIIQVLTSMLSNSIYALCRRAEASGADYKPLIRLSIVVGEEVELHLYDNGIGMEEGIVEKIFDPFFTTKPTAEAPGVGLYMAQQIIQNHNGTITLSSQKDEFTEFVIKFPKLS